ncbi:four helix bundle protein [Phormidium tenue FACHB-886]|nr:four helix bundle protein [Phormidium tenue FACHB-886]
MGEQSIQQQSFEFALCIIRLYKKLQARQEFILSPQLLRSGTSIGVAVEEAIALSPQEGIDKLKSAAMTARETRYWLKLLQESRLVDIDVSSELKQVDQLLYTLANLIQP